VAVYLLKALHDDIELLGTETWEDAVDHLVAFLKPKLQRNGAIKTYREIYNTERTRLLQDNETVFLSNKSLDNLDERINIYTKRISDVNNTPQRTIYHNFYETVLRDSELRSKHPEIAEISRILFEDDNNFSTIAKIRLSTIVTRISVESGIQSNKSNAGGAGENFVRMMLQLAGLQEGVHYREQYQSRAGSDTDFVFPYVEHMRDFDVQIFLAVQFSSNDRLRLVQSELKQGAECYALTGNGLDASTKKLKDIGKQIIQKVKESNHKLVCYGPEIKSELRRLRNHKDSESAEIIDRIDYLENYAISFEDFAKKLRDRFVRN